MIAASATVRVVASSATSSANSHYIFSGAPSAPPEELLVELVEHICPYTVNVMPTGHPALCHHACLEVEQCGSHGTALPKTILNLNLIQQLTIHMYLCLHILMEGSNDGIQLDWNVKLLQRRS